MAKPQQKQVVEKRVSTKREDMVKGGSSLFDDVDVTIRNPRYEPFVYPKSNVEVPSLALDFYWDEPMEDGREFFDQHFSAGGKSKLMPSRDGEYLVAEDPEDPPEGLNDSSNLGIFYSSLDQLAPHLIDVRDEKGVTAALDGLRIHLKNKVPEGQIQGKDRNPVLCVSKVYSGKGKSSGGSGAGKSASKAKADEGGDDADTDTPEQSDMEIAVEAAVVKMLKKAKEPLSRKELMVGLNDFFEGAEKREAVEVLVTPSFLRGEGHPWEWDGKVASL